MKSISTHRESLRSEHERFQSIPTLFLLILTNIWLFDPMGYAVTIDPHDLDRSTNVRRVPVYLCLDELPSSPYRRNVGIEYSTGREDGEPPIDTTAWAYKPDRAHMLVTFADLELYQVSNQSTGILAIDDDAHDRTLFERYVARWRVGFKNVVQQWHHLPHQRCYSTVQRSAGSNRTGRDAFKINILPSNLSNHGEVQLTSFSNLADIWLFVSVCVSGAAIGSNHDFLISPHEGYGGAVREAAAKDERRNRAKDQQPKWIRHRYLSPTVCWRNGSLDTTCAAESEDIDVSMDGKAWFHAIGVWCPDGLPDWHPGIPPKRGTTAQRLAPHSVLKTAR